MKMSSLHGLQGQCQSDLSWSLIPSVDFQDQFIDFEVFLFFSIDELQAACSRS
jgi:hypothetical protein